MGRHRYETIRESLVQGGFFESDQAGFWQTACHPFPLSAQELTFFEQLGNHLLAFYRALNRLYLDSVRGHQPQWVHWYLDRGKPDSLLSYARMNRFRNHVPDVIRPDIIPTDRGMIVTELDSVPGGIGLTGILGHTYGRLGDAIVGGSEGMCQGFAKMLYSCLGHRPPVVGLVVSDEAEPYRTEMTWVASQLGQLGIEAACIHPRDLRFTEEGLLIPDYFGDRLVSGLYRFFELFDLKNIPKSELVMYSLKKGRVVVTPPYKPWLEEKLAFALVHHPMLEPYWKKALAHETWDLLKRRFPQTWVLDPQPVPPPAIIPGLTLGGRAIADWAALSHTTQKERQFVLKPSGFSELAWGSRGVVIGHDLSQPEWAGAVERALGSFSTTPYVLQEFHKGQVYHVEYYDEQDETWKTMEGRARLSPYYCVQGDQAPLAGILATVCPKNKKIIHGMREAVMVPCGPMSPINEV